jgi:Raf kinase inhibitor-like YbhB/YbcL family protein
VSKKLLVAGVILCLALVGGYYIFRPMPQTASKPIVQEASMKLTSPAFEHNQKIPVLYTCDGGNIHPPLEISGVPSGAKSLALIVDDPDAPGGTFTHWVIWNIHPDTAVIEEGAVPEKSQEGTNSAGQIGFFPPCPPSGQHRYFFTLYALDAKLGLDGKATKTDVEKAIAGHVMAQSLFVGVYGR